MRTKSKNMCYDSDIGNELKSKRYLKSLSSSDDEYISELNVNIFDQFSGEPSATEITNHCCTGVKETDDTANYGVVGILPMLCNYIDKSALLVRGLRHQTKMNLVYKYSYELLTMYLSKEINKICVYCTDAKGMDTDDLTAGRYVLTISGYLDNKCKSSFQLITNHNYAMHPSRILSDIETRAKKQNLNVVIDEDSFKECIKRMKTNNELDNEDMVLDDLQINKALDLIDKKAESIKK